MGDNPLTARYIAKPGNICKPHWLKTELIGGNKMAQKSYDQKLRRRWARRKAKDDANRKAKLADFNKQMTEGRLYANAAISTIFDRR